MKDLKPLDIVLAGVRVGHSTDPRPCIVLEIVPAVGPILAPCSAQLDLYDENLHFLIPSDHLDFGATKLDRTTYVLEDEPILLEFARIRRRYGALTGGLAAGFKRWYGVD